MAEEQEQNIIQNPGLPEAINPEIANHAAWEQVTHNLNLRLPDPSKSIDDLLLNDADKTKVISKWKNPMADPNSVPINDEQINVPPPLEDIPVKKKPKEKKLVSSSQEKSQLPEWLENIEDELVLKEDPNGPKEIFPEPDTISDTEPGKEFQPEGKRIKKAAKKARKELEKSKTALQIRLPSITESTLSAFTSWLKSLKGSEYVHPYEDDYALGQQNEGISETLADLLAAQGYKEQAIDMYSELMAKYPEKSSFFAAKIEALK
ncbi:MAG TPA: hypothetical protein VMZ69_04160 [Saprospiraceae bacterium]|nr:hypothetical protein [Saprospiraceae bacterium]